MSVEIICSENLKLKNCRSNQLSGTTRLMTLPKLEESSDLGLLKNIIIRSAIMSALIHMNLDQPTLKSIYFPTSTSTLVVKLRLD